MSLILESFIKIDDKGRLRIPTALKEGMSEESKNKFVISRGMENCLNLYPYDVWVVEKQKVDKKNSYNPIKRRFIREFYSGASELTIDSSDRINIPNQLIGYANITKEVVLTPFKSWFEIWDRNTYEKYLGDGSMSYEELAFETMGDEDDDNNEN